MTQYLNLLFIALSLTIAIVVTIKVKQIEQQNIEMNARRDEYLPFLIIASWAPFGLILVYTIISHLQLQLQKESPILPIPIKRRFRPRGINSTPQSRWKSNWATNYPSSNRPSHITTYMATLR